MNLPASLVVREYRSVYGLYSDSTIDDYKRTIQRLRAGAI